MFFSRIFFQIIVSTTLFLSLFFFMQNLLSSALSTNWKEECQRISIEYNLLKKCTDKLIQKEQNKESNLESHGPQSLDMKNTQFDTKESTQTNAHTHGGIFVPEVPQGTFTKEMKQPYTPIRRHTDRDMDRDRHTHTDKDGDRDRDRDTHRDRDRSRDSIWGSDRDRNRDGERERESQRRRDTERESSARVSLSATTSPSSIKSCNRSSPVAVAALMSPVRVSTSGHTQHATISQEYHGRKSMDIQSHIDYLLEGVTSSTEKVRTNVNTVSPMTPIARQGYRTYMGNFDHVMGVITPSPIRFATSSPPDTVHTVQQSPLGLTSTRHQNLDQSQHVGKNNLERDVRSRGIEAGGASLSGTHHPTRYQDISDLKEFKVLDSNMHSSSRGSQYDRKEDRAQGLLKNGTRVGTGFGTGLENNASSSKDLGARVASAPIVSPDVPYSRRQVGQYRQSEQPNSGERRYHGQKDITRSMSSTMDLALINEVEAAVALINAMVTV